MALGLRGLYITNETSSFARRPLVRSFLVAGIREGKNPEQLQLGERKKKKRRKKRRTENKNRHTFARTMGPASNFVLALRKSLLLIS